MKSSKLILFVVVLSVAIGFAFAENYQASINVYPTNTVSASEEIIVFGGIDLLDSDTGLYPSRLKIEVQDSNSGNLVQTYFPDYVSSHRITDYLEDGFFVKKISIGAGSYLFKIKIGDDTKAIKSVSSNNFGTRSAKIKILDYSVYQNVLKVVLSLNNSDINPHDYTIYLISQNLQNPLSFNVHVDNNSVVQFEKEYDYSQFGDGNFILVAQAKEVSGSDVLSSDADYIAVYNYTSISTSTSRNLIISNITFPEQLYAGDLAEVKADIRNYGGAEIQYRFEYVVNNSIFRSGDIRYVQPGHTNEEKFFIEVPEGNMMHVTVRAITDSYSTEKSHDYLIAERVRAYSLVLSDYSAIVFAGNETSFNATIANMGNLEDSYNIKVIGWFDHKMDKDSVSLLPNRAGKVKITLKTVEDNIIGDYPVIINVCNIEDYCVNKTLTLKITKLEKDQNIVTWDKNQINKTFTENGTLSYNISVKNVGISDKNYLLSFEPAMADSINFTLAPEEERTIQFYITPTNNTNKTVKFFLSAQNTTILTEELNLIYKETNGSGKGLTGMFIFEGGSYLPGLYALAVIGIVVAAYLVYTYLGKRVWLSRIEDYNYQSRSPPPIQWNKV